ncbi:hypothetical protein L1887_48349 [Cichorium endivia]|nr:hypothetical protein L1887_48349 [Cichorium endivia]
MFVECFWRFKKLLNKKLWVFCEFKNLVDLLEENNKIRVTIEKDEVTSSSEEERKRVATEGRRKVLLGEDEEKFSFRDSGLYEWLRAKKPHLLIGQRQWKEYQTLLKTCDSVPSGNR